MPGAISTSAVGRIEHSLYLSSWTLANKTTRRRGCAAIARQTQPFDVAMGCGPVLARIALDLADRYRRHFGSRT